MATETKEFVIIGAGQAGIAMGVQLRRQLKTENFEIYDRSSRVGGVWAQNAYPNLFCDIPTDLYSYSFYPKDWPNNYASRKEILEYLEETVAHFGLSSHVKLEQACLSASWSSKDGLWNITFRDIKKGTEYTERARYVVTAVGHSTVPKGIEDVPGLEKFKGDVILSNQWQDQNFHNRNVMVIGNGATANQIVPWLMNEAQVKSLVHVFRQPQWILPKKNAPIPRWKRWIYRQVPLLPRLFRATSICLGDIVPILLSKSIVGNFLRSFVEKQLVDYIKQSPPQYHDKLIPYYSLGGKRPISDHGYIDCTKRDNIILVQGNGIAGVTEDGRQIIDTDGNQHKVDMVILANGFAASQMTAPMQISGEDGTTLRDYWQRNGGIRAYMAVAVSSFPNMFILGGPGAYVLGSQFFSAECSIQYILRILRSLRQRSPEPPIIRPRLMVEQAYDEEIQRRLRSFTVAPTEGVNNWMVDKENGKNFMVWPGLCTELWWTRCVKKIRWEDWEIS